MEQRLCLICIVINSFLISSLVAKTFSLNEAIAAEERNKGTVKTPKLTDSIFKTERFQPLSFHRSNLKEISKSLSTSLLSPLKYKNPFEIKSPLKPKIFRRPQQTVKQYRETERDKSNFDNYEGINQKYIPLFRSLSIILDNIISSDSSEVYPRSQYNGHSTNRFESNDACNCAPRSKTFHLSDSYEKAAASSNFVTTEVETETPSPSSTTPETDHITHYNDRYIGRNKNIPTIPPGNTASIGGDTGRLHEGRSATHIRNDKGSHTGTNGNHEHDTRIRNTPPVTEDGEEDTNNDTRHSASGDKPRTLRPITFNTTDSIANGNNNILVKTSINSTERNLSGREGHNNVTNRGGETESPILLSKSPFRLQRLEPKKAELIQTKDEKDYAAIERYFTSPRRISNLNSQNTTDNKKGRRTNETVTWNKKGHHNKVVMIYDGYSVARDVNGENKMSEKAIEILT